jgi:hypothetical protein
VTHQPIEVRHGNAAVCRGVLGMGLTVHARPVLLYREAGDRSPFGNTASQITTAKGRGALAFAVHFSIGFAKTRIS